MPKDGIAILLNCLPILIISATRSSTVFVTVFSIGERTMPRKIEPPTHIEAQVKCNHMIRLSVKAISFTNGGLWYIIHAARIRKGFNSLRIQLG
jgi:hypothetical protein